MARIVVCGGSVISMSAAMMLADDGHDIIVIQPDPAGPPAAAARAGDDWIGAAWPGSGSRTTCSPGSGKSVTKSAPA